MHGAAWPAAAALAQAQRCLLGPSALCEAAAPGTQPRAQHMCHAKGNCQRCACWRDTEPDPARMC